MAWMHIAAGIAALAGSASPIAAIAAERDSPHVRIDTGEIAGTAGEKTLVFRGIPYAAPPVGPLRWKAPAAASRWEGVRDASHYGAACPQAPDHKEAWAQVGPTSEDCLFLNVWRPKRAGTYPVMVFLHGGGFTYGAAGVPLYEGTHLAERGAVIVTLNYRLGRLGYFAHPALTREDPDGQLGNYGIMDQVAALKWVRRNIARFGGDPANVTLFGESAGAGVVQLLMASPVSTGLFQKAISESGSGGTALFPIRGGALNAEALGQRWTDSLGLRDATVDQLRAIPLAEIIKGRSFPFIDGKVVVQSPGEGFYQRKQMRIPLMIGSNSNEGSLIGNNPEPAKAILGDAYPELLAAYAKRPGSTEKSAAIDLVEDAASVLQSLFVADLHAAAGAKAYGFYFTQVPVDERAGSLGTQHGGEIEYLFGNKAAEHRWDAADEKVSRLTGDYWVRFARTGNPNGGGAPNWPAVSTQPTDYLVIGTDTHATKLTPLEERVQALALDDAKKHWAAMQAR
ncbi:MAG: carboxylesterase family protein [Pseudomonadota bacterium]